MQVVVLLQRNLIKKGEYVCFYDGEIKSNRVGGDDFAYNMENPLRAGTRCVGYKEPRSKLGVGQLINDGCMFTLTDDVRDDEYGLFKLNNTKLNHKIQLYERCSKAKANVIFHDKSFRLYAKRDIAVGEELYLQYGVSYWLGYISYYTDEPFTRLYCLMKNGFIHMNGDGTIDVSGINKTPEEFIAGLRISLYGDIICFLGYFTFITRRKSSFSNPFNC